MSIFQEFYVSQPQSPKHNAEQQPQMSIKSYNSQQTQDDEIDLSELFTMLWQGKWIIIACTFICTALAIAYAFMAKDQWSSTATITPPKFSDYSQLQNQIIPYQIIFSDGNISGSNVSPRNNLDALINADKLYASFIKEFNSSINKKKFVTTSPYFHKKKAQLDAPKDEYGLRKLNTGLSAKPKNLKKVDGSYVLTASAETSQESLEMLNQYIEYINEQVEESTFNILKVTIESKKNELKQQLAMLTEQTKLQLMSEKKRTQYALSIAKAAKISKPLQNFGDNELFAINLGSDALSAKLNVLNSLKDLSVIEPRLEQLNSKLKGIDQLKIDKDVEFLAYQYLEQPERKPSRDKPKRTLVILLGVIAGGMLGIMFSLFPLIIRNK